MSEKNDAIRKTISETRERRKSQTCISYELKIDISHLGRTRVKNLNRIFLEAKWFYNYILSEDDIYNQDYRINRVKIKVKDHYEDRDILLLSSQMKQEIIDKTKDSIRGLSNSKKNGNKIGKLHFKRRINSIPLKQYKNTYNISGKYVRIQRIGRLKVSGIEQIPKDADIANATLESRNGDYFIHISTFTGIKDITHSDNGIGIDFGIKSSLTLSNGIIINEDIPLTGKAIKLHKELSRRKQYGKNWYKTLNKLNKEYKYITQKKKDEINKIVNIITNSFETIAFQNDPIKGWMRLWGRKIQGSAIGGIMDDLKRKSRTPKVVPRYTPTSQVCSKCNHRQKMPLKERTFNCGSCNISIDRDLNASINILEYMVPAERRKFTPMDMKTYTYMMEYLNTIPGVKASFVVDIGSFTALA